MDINLDSFKQILEESLSTTSKEIIESFYVFGSLARGEKIQVGSDIDSVLVLHNKDEISFAEMVTLSKDLVVLDIKLGIEIDHVFCTQDDLFELLSPTLIVNLHADGINVYGSDLKERFSRYIENCPKSQMLNSFLRTDMFRRHQLRKRFLKLDLNGAENVDEKMIIGICKDIILTARDLLYFETDTLITPKKEISSYFLANFSGENEFINLPMLSYNIRYGVVTLETKDKKISYLKRAFDFMEQASLMIQKKYKTITGKEILDIRPF